MIRIGTCSWTEKSMIQSGGFYPGEARSAEERLRYYAGKFNTVEVDSSYYAIPSVKNAQLWAERTPENFLFHIKVYGTLTGHGIDPKSLPADLAATLPQQEESKKYIYIKRPEVLRIIAERFVETLTPLKRAKKLGMIIFQYPPWFRYGSAELEYILSNREWIQGYPMAVEFRHGSWLAPDKAETVFRFLQEHGITYIAADEPQYGSPVTIPFLPEVTTEIAYFRLHGRNKENWLKKGIETSLRYDYFYSDDELRSFIPAIRGVAERASRTFVMFNNCHGASAFKNALRLGELLSEASHGAG